MKTIVKGFLFGIGMYFGRDFYKGFNRALNRHLLEKSPTYKEFVNKYYSMENL